MSDTSELEAGVATNATQTISIRVREFVLENFYVPDPTMVTPETSLLDRGIVDSTGILELVEFLQSEFELRVEDTEIVPENLDSIEQITAFVARKKSG